MFFGIIVIVFSIILNVTILASPEVQTYGEFKHSTIMCVLVFFCDYLLQVAGYSILGILQKFSCTEYYIHLKSDSLKF